MVFAATPNFYEQIAGRLNFPCIILLASTQPLGPAEYDVSGVTFLSPTDQEALPYRISSLLPWNHISRKNVGYMYAIHHGAKVTSAGRSTELYVDDTLTVLLEIHAEEVAETPRNLRKGFTNGSRKQN